MSEKEMAELNTFLAERVMGWAKAGDGTVFRTQENLHKDSHAWRPTTDPAAAMAVLEKCCEEVTTSIRKQSDGSFCIWFNPPPSYQENYVIAPTLQLSIALFAKKLHETKT